ncbi:histidine--tRNA ligase, partial [Bacillus sp. SIMBA_005]
NPTLPMPFKRYEIGKVFRDGPIKAGRFREFTQCDVDIVGVDSQAAEAELMMMALDAFEKLEQDVVIQYNNRKLLVGLLGVFGVDA